MYTFIADRLTSSYIYILAQATAKFTDGVIFLHFHYVLVRITLVCQAKEEMGAMQCRNLQLYRDLSTQTQSQVRVN